MDRFAEIARCLGLEGNTAEELTDAYNNMLRDMNRQLDIPLTLKDYGLSREDFEANLDKISENAVKDACTGSNPRQCSKEDFVKLFTCIYEGNKVDF